jgi:hypothetical protein
MRKFAVKLTAVDVANEIILHRYTRFLETYTCQNLAVENEHKTRLWSAVETTRATQK